MQRTKSPTLDPATRLSLAPLFRLQFEPAQHAWVLLFPEGLVRLNTPAAEILRRCDGVRSVDDIVAELEAAFAPASLRADVHDFLVVAHRQGWVAPAA
jgi:pyrroloquinoline quinone biosynthesis protein D